MIKKINKIKDFGIFQNFNWGFSIPEFEKYNAIYGWNYSGKTTLSRIFRCFELGLLHDDYGGATFEVEDDKGVKYDQSNLNPLFDVRVFNSDFVEDNLKWEGDIEPVILLGEENIKLQKQLEENKKTLDEKKKTIEEFQRDKWTKEEKIETALTNKARDIKNTLSIPDYDKTNLKPTVEKIASAPNTNLLSDEQVQNYLTKYRSTEKKEKIPTITLSIPNMPALCEQTQVLLKKTATANIIKKLRKDPTLEKWFREGKEIHKDKSHCEFCGGKLPDDLLDKLNAHFSVEYENLLSEIENLIKDLENNKISLYIVDETDLRKELLPDKARFYTELEEDYEQSKTGIGSEDKSFNASVDELIKVLKTKKSKPFDALVIKQIQDNTNQLKAEIEKANGIIQNHNYKIDEFDKEKEQAKKNLIKHWASEFVIEEKYMETLAEIKDNASGIKKLVEEKKTIQNKINEIEQQLSDTAKGAEAVNQHLRSYFGTDEIKIEVTEDNKFKLVRSGIKATNLSAGEKTAIAFAHFMTKLEDKNTTLTKTIVFIDDPVSSLDCNHLFHTYSFIKNKLADCKQIFISTHNFEFFNLIKDWFNEIQEIKDYLSKRKNRLETKWSCYLIEKLKNAKVANCKISELPELLLKFKSEYTYLFSLLYKFNQLPTPDYNYLYILPNLVRRYLEAFLGFKMPIVGGLKKKLPALIKEQIPRDKIDKFINQYSHNQSLPRSLDFPPLSECKDVIDTVLRAVKDKDEEHYNALIETCRCNGNRE